MSCDFTEQVSLLIDGELPANEASRIERHIVACEECQKARADFLNFRREISDYQISLDPRAQERVLAEILSGRHSTDVQQPAAPSWRERFVSSFGVPRFAMATACVLFLVAGVIGFMLYRGTHRESEVAQRPTNDRPAPEVAQAPEPQPSQRPPDIARQKTVASAPDKGRTRDRRLVAQTPTNRTREPQAPSTQLPPGNPAQNFVAVSANTAPNSGLVSSADAETLTGRHLEQSSLLLRAFRNARVEENIELNHEKNRARHLLYQNILLRREATTKGNIQVATLLDSLEPILIDIANLPAKPDADEVRTIKQRMERKNLVALLQINSTELARAFD